MKSLQESNAEDLLKSAAHYWHAFVLRGILMLFFGLLFVIYPDATLDTITRVFGAFLVIDGVICLLEVTLFCCLSAGFRLWAPYFLSSLVSLIIGGYSLANPSMVSESFVLLAGAWFLLIGLLEILVACILRSGMTGATCGCMTLGGLVYVIFGAVLLSKPGAVVTTLVRIAGVLTILFGLEVSFFGCQLRSLKNTDGSDFSSNQAAAMV